MMGTHHRIDLPGRVSCLTCRGLYVGEFGLKQHRRAKHPLPPARRRLRADLVGRDGRMRCRAVDTRLKVIYETRDDAWVMAWTVFALKGHLLTPYQCAPFLLEFGGQRPRAIYRPGCGRWHLARTEHVLMFPAERAA